MSTVVHVAPHPDDEALGAPAALLLLRRAGFDVVNAVVSLGRADDRDRRRREAIDAARRAEFELVIADPPFAISSTDDLDATEPLLATWLRELVERRSPALVVSPSPDDAHPGHAVAGRAIRRALSAAVDPPLWWTWGLWADLPQPTVYVPFGDDVLEEAQDVLRAYIGELTRNDYARLLTARATVNAVLGSERVFGFGRERASSAPYADLLTELRLHDGEWQPQPPRCLDPREPLAARDTRASGQR